MSSQDRTTSREPHPVAALTRPTSNIPPLSVVANMSGFAVRVALSLRQGQSSSTAPTSPDFSAQITPFSPGRFHPCRLPCCLRMKTRPCQDSLAAIMGCLITNGTQQATLRRDVDPDLSVVCSGELF